MKTPANENFIIKILENVKNDKEISDEEFYKKKISGYKLMNKLIQIFSENLNDFKIKKAIIISKIFQIVLLFLITLTYFTFINKTLYDCDINNFIIHMKPSTFDFVYYTLKSITFSSIDYIKPNSIYSKIVEMFSYLINVIFISLILIQYIQPLRENKISENINKANLYFNYQKNILRTRVIENYQFDLQFDLIETDSEQLFYDWIRKFIKKIF